MTDDPILELKELMRSLNKILFNDVYSQNNILLTAKFVVFLCPVISKDKAVALVR